MMVDKVGNVNPLADLYRRQTRAKDVETAVRGDSVEISSAGRAASVRQSVVSLVSNAPEIRQDRVKEARERLERGEYLSDKVIEQVAERIASSIVKAQAK